MQALNENVQTWKTRIYHRIPDNTIVNPDNRISLEIQLTKSLTNKLTFFWKRKAFNEFVKKSLFLYITAMNDVQKSTITELYDLLILPKLNSYLNDVKEERLLNNSIVNPINCMATQNFKQFNFCLENTNEFVSFLALYRQIIIHSKKKLWKLEKYLVIPFQNVNNASKI